MLYGVLDTSNTVAHLPIEKAEKILYIHVVIKRVNSRLGRKQEQDGREPRSVRRGE